MQFQWPMTLSAREYLTGLLSIQTHSWYNFDLSHLPSLLFTLQVLVLNIDNLLDFFPLWLFTLSFKTALIWPAYAKEPHGVMLMSNGILQVLCSRSRQMLKQMVGRRRMKGRSHGNYAISLQRAIMALCATTSFLKSVWRQNQWQEWRDCDMNCFSQRDFLISKLQNEKGYF